MTGTTEEYSESVTVVSKKTSQIPPNDPRRLKPSFHVGKEPPKNSSISGTGRIVGKTRDGHAIREMTSYDIVKEQAMVQEFLKRQAAANERKNTPKR